MRMILNICRGINCIQRLQISYQSLVRDTKCGNYILRKSFHASPKCSFNIRNTRCNNLNNLQLKVNTDIQNNVILYKNENRNDFIILKIISYGWIICNTVLMGCTYNPKYIETFFKKITWKEYIYLHGLNLCYFTYSISLGIGSCYFLYVVNQRIVRYIILHKGGKQVSVLTNHLFKRYNTISLPVDEVKTKIAREKMVNYLAIKLKGHRFYYLLDAQGKFPNTRLFDYTVGKSKDW
ncbi:uncharacterized protein LOC143424729 [Xylocopa sonorina]|uniref:uncharacterized protein LOC143424729 n=1 Tax=Xylocopa sonorina TaxID=1818115 RepID=UPI00403B2D3A